LLSSFFCGKIGACNCFCNREGIYVFLLPAGSPLQVSIIYDVVTVKDRPWVVGLFMLIKM
jgi:hypothetical protein